MLTILYGEVIDDNLLNTTFHNDLLCNIFECGQHDKASNIIIFHYLYRRHPQIVLVVLLMLFIVVCLGLFLGFHLYITSQNMTTNEYYKLKKLSKLHSKGSPAYLNNDATPIQKKDRTNRSNISDMDEDVGCMGPAKETGTSSAQLEGEISVSCQMPTNMYK